MKLKVFITIILFLSFNFSFCQNFKKDSLAVKMLQDSIALILNTGKSPKKIIPLANKMFEIAKTDNRLKLYEVTAYRSISVSYMLQQKIDSFNIYILKALRYFEKDSSLIHKDSDAYISVLFGASLFEENKGNYHKAYNFLLKGLEHIPDDHHNSIFKVYSGLSRLKRVMNDKEGAKKLAYKALNIEGKTELATNLIYFDLGTIYRKTNLDSAYYYYTKAAEYFKYNKSQLTYHGYNAYIAGILIDKGKIKEAKALLKTTLEFQEKNKNIDLLGYTYLQLAEIAFIEKNNTLEFEMLQKAEKFLKNDVYIADKQELYSAFINYYRNKNDFKNKLAYELKLEQIKDTIQNKEKIFLANELEIKYHTQLKEAEIKEQKQLIAIQKRQKNKLIFILIFIVGLLFTTFFLYRKRLQTQRMLLKKQKELAEEKMKTLVESQKVKSIEAQLKGQNSERERIAKDLHDSISGNLAAIKMKLTNIKDESSKEIAVIITNIDTTYNEVRTISHNLLPKKFNEQDFVKSLDNLLELYKTENLDIEFDSFPREDVNKITPKIQTEVYRVLQELVTNIVKHAKASKVTVNITLHDNYLNLLVEDNGKGFDSTKIKKGMGLHNINSRIGSLKGTLDLDSLPHKGTTIHVNIPIN